MRPLHTLKTVLEMIKFGWCDLKIIVFKHLPLRRSRRVSTMSAGGVISVTVRIAGEV